jgi:hypothetical protein
MKTKIIISTLWLIFAVLFLVFLPMGPGFWANSGHYAIKVFVKLLNIYVVIFGQMW